MSFACPIAAANTDVPGDMRIAWAGRMTRSATADALDRLTDQIIGAAIEVNRELGPGMLESAYEACLAHELVRRGLMFERQRALSLTYKGQVLDCGYRIDILVERAVVVEIKSVERFDRVHFAQVQSYLRQSGCRVGLLFNFNTKYLGLNGIKRIVNNFPDAQITDERTINAELAEHADTRFTITLQPADGEEPRKT